MPFYLCPSKSTYVRQWLQLLPLRGINNKCMYVGMCVYVCVCVCMYICMYVCMYVLPGCRVHHGFWCELCIDGFTASIHSETRLWPRK